MEKTNSDIIIYKMQDGEIKIETRLEDETFCSYPKVGILKHLNFKLTQKFI